MSFTLEEDILLAEYVSKHPCLYDSKNAEYKDQQIRDNVWKEISNILKKSVDDCKKRWKNMKDTYNKNKRNKKLGTGSFLKNKPTKWALAGTLSFMDVCSYEQVGMTNFKNEMNNSEEEDTLIQAVEDENNSNYVNNCSCISTTEPTMEQPELENILETEKIKLFKEKRPTKKIKRVNEELVSVFNKSCDERQNILNTINKDEKDEDPTDAFFKTMAITVKSFPQHLKIKAKKEVFNLITDLEIESYNSTSTSK
ncbi:unnamed protein product [Macrosiphum euphorbiae]|nr:unnamed protein product [Macrosiphum euphorbiae]